MVDATVSAPPVIHPRPPVSETTTPVKASPAPPPPTATSGPQGDRQYPVHDNMNMFLYVSICPSFVVLITDGSLSKCLNDFGFVCFFHGFSECECSLPDLEMPLVLAICLIVENDFSRIFHSRSVGLFIIKNCPGFSMTWFFNCLQNFSACIRSQSLCLWYS